MIKHKFVREMCDGSVGGGCSSLENHLMVLKLPSNTAVRTAYICSALCSGIREFAALMQAAGYIPQAQPYSAPSTLKSGSTISLSFLA